MTPPQILPSQLITWTFLIIAIMTNIYLIISAIRRKR